ncbi:MAG: group III truncated hemoglobin [Pseudomonadota bacterium]
MDDLNDTERDEFFRVRGEIVRTPLHASITEAQISNLVETFYDRVWADERLGPIFAGRVSDRPEHLVKMKRFWSSVLLKTAAYSGRPMPAHMKLSEVEEADFARWLTLFESAAIGSFEPEAAERVIETAKRIARSFWLAMFGGLIQGKLPTPPEWARA